MADLIEREKQQREARRELTVRPPVPVPPREETPAIVRWIQWSVVVAAVGALVVAAFVLGESNDGLDSTLVPMGERYTSSDFDVGFRWIGESGSTIEQIEELTTAPLVPMGERYTDPNFDVSGRFVGESDMTLEEFEALRSLMAADVVADEAMWASLIESEGLSIPEVADGSYWTSGEAQLDDALEDGFGAAAEGAGASYWSSGEAQLDDALEDATTV